MLRPTDFAFTSHAPRFAASMAPGPPPVVMTKSSIPLAWHVVETRRPNSRASSYQRSPSFRRAPPNTTSVVRMPSWSSWMSAFSSSSMSRTPRSSRRARNPRSSCALRYVGDARIASRFAFAAGSSGTGGAGGSGRWVPFTASSGPSAFASAIYLTLAPEGTAGSTMRSDGAPVSGSVAARIIPFDSTPMSFAGARFATKTNFFPTSCSGV